MRRCSSLCVSKVASRQVRTWTPCCACTRHASPWPVKITRPLRKRSVSCRQAWVPVVVPAALAHLTGCTVTLACHYRHCTCALEALPFVVVVLALFGSLPGVYVSACMKQVCCTSCPAHRCVACCPVSLTVQLHCCSRLSWRPAGSSPGRPSKPWDPCSLQHTSTPSGAALDADQEIYLPTVIA